MAYNIVGQFFDIVDLGLFDIASVMLILGFLVYEIPRSIKIINEEYTKGFYPETGRVIDFFLLAIGLITIAFFRLSAIKIIAFLKSPGVIAFFLILLAVIPIIIIVGYLKRFFARIDTNKSITIFLVHSFLDFMHTLFYLGLTILAIPALGFLIFGKP
ncbi:hypothetical protein JXA56_00985 [Candidatus Micrarchaeota archaeon]|nr:hypothetical protein [Candidatus Micrarchaeota archaeon]